MKLVYTLSCGISRHHKFFISMKNGAKDVVKLLYSGDEHIKRSSIVQSTILNNSKKYVVIGSKNIDEKTYNKYKNKYSEIKHVTNEGLWNRYWQLRYSEFMSKFNLEFEFLPMIIVSGYHILGKHIMGDKAYYFKANNLTENIQNLKENGFAKVDTKKGERALCINEVFTTYDVNDPRLKDLHLKDLHDLKPILIASKHDNNEGKYPVRYKFKNVENDKK